MLSFWQRLFDSLFGVGSKCGLFRCVRDFKIEEEIKPPSLIMCVRALREHISFTCSLAFSKKKKKKICAEFAYSNITVMCPSTGLLSGISKFKTYNTFFKQTFYILV